MIVRELPIPPHFDAGNAAVIWKVDYQKIAALAGRWAREHGLRPARKDERRVGLLLVDCQNTFCTPGFELFVAGRSGKGAVEDSIRICRFIYRNLAALSDIVISMDTHRAFQIFHAPFLIDERGEHPQPYTQVSVSDVESGRWRVNPALVEEVEGKTADELQRYLLHYCRTLKETGKYELMIWPFHSMLGGIGHALVASVEEAVFFHTIARQHQAKLVIKGDSVLTENYSVLGPEVTSDENGEQIALENEPLIEHLLSFDKIIVAGEAKSHCVAWTIQDLLAEMKKRDAAPAGRVYLLEDCTSPVVVAGAQDFTEQADRAFGEFAAAGVHIVKSTDSIATWPGTDG